MKVTSQKNGQNKPRQNRPATSPESMEQEMQALAMGLALERLRNGTASNQLICEVIKSASSERKLKREIMEEQKELLAAKTEAIRDAKDMKEMYSKALNAMRTYSGLSDDDDGLLD